MKLTNAPRNTGGPTPEENIREKENASPMWAWDAKIMDK